MYYVNIMRRNNDEILARIGPESSEWAAEKIARNVDIDYEQYSVCVVCEGMDDENASDR